MTLEVDVGDGHRGGHLVLSEGGGGSGHVIAVAEQGSRDLLWTSRGARRRGLRGAVVFFAFTGSDIFHGVDQASFVGVESIVVIPEQGGKALGGAGSRAAP